MKLLRLSVGVALTACIAGCVSAPAPTNVTGYQLSQLEIEAVKAGVVSNLKDPLSALFGERIVAATAGGEVSIFVCGTVNAKNSFGGYVGDKPFFGRLLPASFPGSGGSARFVVELMGGDDFSVRFTQNRCASYGLYVS